MNLLKARAGPDFNLQTRRGSTKLILFFGGFGAQDGRFQYWKVGKALGTHCLFLSDGRKHWYQSGVPGLGHDIEETLASIRTCAAELGVKDIYTFGQSMGAHGAILYGAKLGAKVMAFGAETILGLEASRSDRLLQADATILYPDLHGVIASAARPVFAFAGEEDPVDLYCMSKASGLPNYHPRTIVGQGHHLAAYLHQSDRLIPLLRAFVEDRPLPLTGEEGDVLARLGLADAFYDLHRHSRARRRTEAAEAGQRTLSLNARSRVALHLTAKALLETGRAAEALDPAEQALAIAPDIIAYRFLLARTVARLGDLDRAMSLYKEIVATQPDHAPAYNQIAGIHYKRGDFFAAREATRRALELRPGHATFANLGERIEKRIAALSVQANPLQQDESGSFAGKVSSLFRTLKGTVARRP
ncbi:hypothetical protein RB623_22115 [Mesorhizobium sp. LHD-90]|uniref:tetratricopeptide repeat protein n=1 Tax=Mesorhizobium sp. LHD-90 TaxID=3071414 RepID=UPI0027E0A261|nr:tetratricopeptide repeat protein [Mesorhizobium sp. LHD-90]MDQ6436756.1 hypothetical protein [Mesorhizobium sp. LHD-90]